MKAATRHVLPLVPLLRAYTAAGVPGTDELGRLAVLGPRFAAVLTARTTLLAEPFLDGAREAEFVAALLRFYEAAVPQPLHADLVRRRAGIVRHALGHLLRGAGPLSRKVDQCLGLGGAYRVGGLGPAFWSALM